LDSLIEKHICPFGVLMRISAPDLKKVRAALSHKNAILKYYFQNKEEGKMDKANRDETMPAEENIWGEGVKVVTKCTLNRKPLTPDERDAFVTMYEAGATMSEIAKIYKCHYTTVGKILRQMGVEIRA